MSKSTLAGKWTKSDVVRAGWSLAGEAPRNHVLVEAVGRHFVMCQAGKTSQRNLKVVMSLFGSLVLNSNGSVLEQVSSHARFSM